MTYYGVDEMREDERKEFIVWYESQRSETFENRHVLESYFQDDITVLKQACRVFRREFVRTGHIDVFFESITIASACNKVLRKRFLKPDMIGLIPTGGYTCNNRYSRRPCCGSYIWRRRTLCRSCTVAKDVNTGCRNYLA